MVSVRYSMAYKFSKNFVSHLLLLICFRILLVLLGSAEISTCCTRCGLLNDITPANSHGALSSSDPILCFDDTTPKNGYVSIVTKDFRVKNKF
ncbi:hypothetical protein D5086_013995 [Populus alba]|uniref:Uncharacterized protein n=1 Tax=Populus alba TaxID=43335 RepID=A0ACC4C784_POPAL